MKYICVKKRWEKKKQEQNAGEWHRSDCATKKAVQ